MKIITKMSYMYIDDVIRTSNFKLTKANNTLSHLYSLFLLLLVMERDILPDRIGPLLREMLLILHARCFSNQPYHPRRVIPLPAAPRGRVK